jgi:hypothetical protein
MINNEGETMTPEETPKRKKPAVRKSTVIQDSSASPRTRKVAVKKSAAKKQSGQTSIESEKKKGGLLKVILLMILAALISSGLTYSITSKSSTASPAAATSTFTEVIAGKVALTEPELIAAVKQLGVDVYWAGPVKDAKYTLAVPADGQAYVRYLPNGQGIEDTKPNYVVIATYTTTDAFTATQAAGNTTNGVTFVNTEGAAVYYNKDTPTNVYVAYPNLNYQIEVFHPIATTALEIASKAGALRVIK